MALSIEPRSPGVTTVGVPAEGIQLVDASDGQEVVIGHDDTMWKSRPFRR